MSEQLEKECLLAINLFDMDRITSGIRDRMGLRDKSDGGNLDASTAVKTDDKRESEAGVLFSCEIERAALILDEIRNQDTQAGDVPTRAYLKIGDKPWKKLVIGVPLTIVEYGQCRLNPKVFPVKRQPPIPMTKPPKYSL